MKANIICASIGAIGAGIAGAFGGWDAALVAQIARLYVTHPGVTADGIMTKLGL